MIYLFGKYEEDLVNKFIAGIRNYDCQTVMDIGSNIGYYSLSVQQSHKVDEIHCFEPDPLNLHMLKTNLLINHLQERIKVHPYAATSETRRLRFQLQRNKNYLNTGLSRLLEDGETAEGREIEVEGKAIDEMFDYRDRNIAIKIDVEGAEHLTLKGMSKLLSNNLCFLQIEIWPGNLDKTKSILEPLGYSILEVSRSHDYYWTNKNNFKRSV